MIGLRRKQARTMRKRQARHGGRGHTFGTRWGEKSTVNPYPDTYKRPDRRMRVVCSFGLDHVACSKVLRVSASFSTSINLDLVATL